MTMYFGTGGASQFTVLDEVYVHEGWHENWRDASAWPADWASPVDYTQGDAYFRIELMEYTGEPYGFMCQPCVFWGAGGAANHACFHRGGGAFTFEQGHLYTRYVTMSLPSMWQYEKIDFSDINRFMLIDNFGNDDGIDKGIPQPRLRFECIIVEEGGTFEAPAHWIEPDDWSACTHGCREVSDTSPAGISSRGAGSGHGASTVNIVVQTVQAERCIQVSRDCGEIAVVMYDIRGRRIAQGRSRTATGHSRTVVVPDPDTHTRIAGGCYLLVLYTKENGCVPRRVFIRE